MRTKLYSAYYREKDPFALFEKTIAFGDISELKDDGILVLWGGADISPSIYGQKPNKFCHAGAEPSERDLFEIECFDFAVKHKMPIIGVCRGAQLATALSGGSLVQHADNHNCGTHLIETVDEKIIKANSIHHQMMFLKDIEHQLIAWSEKKLSNRYVGEDEQPIEMDKEPEIAWIPSTQTLAIQGHPEYLYPTHPFVEYCGKYVRTLMNKDVL